MMKSFRLIIIFFIAVFASCEVNELPEDTFTEPEFFAEGTVNGESFHLIAGPENVIVESDVETITNEYPEFESVFFNSECNNCTELLEISIIGNEEFELNLPFEHFISEDPYAVTAYIEEPINTDFTYSLNLDEDYFVSIINQDTQELIQGADDFTLTEGEYSMIYINQISTDCEFAYSGGFSVNNQGDICLQQIDIYEEGGILLIDFSDFEDLDEMSISSDGGFINLDPTDAPIPLELLIGPEGNGDIIILSSGEDLCYNQLITYTFNNFNLMENCFQDIEFEETVSFNPVQPQTVKIRYVDTDGNEYVSDEELPSDYFNILNIESYSLDPLDREAYKVQVEFLATLYNTENPSSTITLDITEGYIPIVFE